VCRSPLIRQIERLPSLATIFANSIHSSNTTAPHGHPPPEFTKFSMIHVTSPSAQKGQLIEIRHCLPDKYPHALPLRQRAASARRNRHARRLNQHFRSEARSASASVSFSVTVTTSST